MRFSLWLLSITALMTGGCVLPCTNGACSSSGEPRFVPPAMRFMGTEKLTGSGCASGSCQPKPYFTFSKYWPSLDKWTSTKTAKRCADRNLLRQQVQCRKWISGHYKAGYRDAFVDIANGESGEVPAVPPSKYWNTHYRTEKGKRCVELYFDGYRAGAAQAAADLMPLTTIGASHDWTIQKPNAPFVSARPFIPRSNGQGGNCSTGDGCSPSGPATVMAPPASMRSAGCQPGAGCQTGAAAGQPSVWSMSPQSPVPGIGSTNTYPGPGNYAPGPTPDQQSNAYPAPRGPQYLPEPAAPPQQLQSHGNPNYGSQPATMPQTQQNLNPPALNQHQPHTNLPLPGYADPGALPAPRQPTQPQLPQPNTGYTGATTRQQDSGSLRPGFSGNLPSMALPGRLGPPDQFKSDPPAFQVTPPRR